jgi:hypothetical protein
MRTVSIHSHNRPCPAICRQCINESYAIRGVTQDLLSYCLHLQTYISTVIFLIDFRN